MINATYPFGSTGKIVKALDDYYNEIGYDTFVLYGHGKITDSHHIKVSNDLLIKLHSLHKRLTGIMYGGCYFSTNNIIKCIKKIRPDIVHLHCLNSNFVNIYKLITWLKSNNIPTVLTNHAEFMYTANCGHALDCIKYQTGCGNCPRLKKETKSWFRDGTHKSWIKMKSAFNGFKSLIVVNVSPWLNHRSENSSILGTFKNVTILNGVNTSAFYYRNNYSFSKEKTIFHATANFSDNPDDNKGGRFLIQLAKRFEGQNVKFIVAGKYKSGISVPSNMFLLGNVSDQKKLAELYSNADLVVLTSKKETFSMVTAESLCCGTPVIGFKSGGPELITIPEYSEFVEYGNIDALFNATKRFLNSSFDKKIISAAAKQKYSEEEMSNNYLRVYKECINLSE